MNVVLHAKKQCKLSGHVVDFLLMRDRWITTLDHEVRYRVHGGQQSRHTCDSQLRKTTK